MCTCVWGNRRCFAKLLYFSWKYYMYYYVFLDLYIIYVSTTQFDVVRRYYQVCTEWSYYSATAIQRKCFQCCKIKIFLGVHYLFPPICWHLILRPTKTKIISSCFWVLRCQPLTPNTKIPLRMLKSWRGLNQKKWEFKIQLHRSVLRYSSGKGT